ncbi:hypothetical protein JCM16303_003779 [Sporobolomyces ruberrimus]
MDLDALRKAALSSKKRKLAAHLSNGPAPGNDSEKEEGEIDDDEEHVQPVDRVALDTSPAHDPAAFTAVKEECKGIIALLLSYGIPADYLISIGVSREILRIS